MTPMAVNVTTAIAAATRMIRRRLRRFCLSVSAWADGTAVLSGGLAAKGAARVEAEAVAWPPERAASANARAKSVHRANRSAGSFARATASTGSKAASSGRVSASCRRWRGEVAADYGRWVGLREQWLSRQQMVGRGR